MTEFDITYPPEMLPRPDGDGADVILPCPFCGSAPQIEPIDPDNDFDLWGCVRCVNEKCSARPEVDHGERVIVMDGRSSRFYVDAAIRRWNSRP